MVRRLLILFLVCAWGLPARAQPAAPLSNVAVRLDGEAGGPGDIKGVTISTTSPLTGGSACTTGNCSFTLGISATPSFTSLSLTGTGGAGFLELASQASAPSAPAAGKFRLWADGGGVYLQLNPSGVTTILTDINPVTVPQGGTNATTASGARTNLGVRIGTDVQAFDSDLSALAANTTNGLWARTGAGTGSARTITGTANKVDVTNGDGGSGNPTLTIPDAVTLVTPTITGVTTFSAGSTQVITQPTSDGTSTGPKTCSYNSGYSSTAVGDAVYLDSSATWQKTDADASATTYSGMVGIALEVKASGAAVCVALPGSMVYAAAAFPTFTVGGQIYLSQTAGAVTQTAPSAAGSAVVRIGWAINADMMFLSPPSIPVLQ